MSIIEDITAKETEVKAKNIEILQKNVEINAQISILTPLQNQAQSLQGDFNLLRNQLEGLYLEKQLQDLQPPSS